MQAEGILLQQNQKGKQGAGKAAGQQATAEAVGADNAGHPVLLRGHTRKRQADSELADAEAALDTQAAELQPAVVESRVQDGQQEQEGEPTLEQRVQALHLHQSPAGVPSTFLCTAASVHDVYHLLIYYTGMWRLGGSLVQCLALTTCKYLVHKNRSCRVVLQQVVIQCHQM